MESVRDLTTVLGEMMSSPGASALLVDGERCARYVNGGRVAPDANSLASLIESSEALGVWVRIKLVDDCNGTLGRENDAVLKMGMVGLPVSSMMRGVTSVALAVILRPMTISAASTLGSGLLFDESSHRDGVGLAGGVGILVTTGRFRGETAVQSILDEDLWVYADEGLIGEATGRRAEGRLSVDGDVTVEEALARVAGLHGLAGVETVQAGWLMASRVAVRSCDVEDA